MRFRYITRPENAGQIPVRILSTLIARPLAHTPLTPNHVTLFRALIVVTSLHFFARGDSGSLFAAVALFYTFEVLDHVDGDLARLTAKTSAIGSLLEQFVDTWASRPSNIFGVCVAFGMFRQTGSVTGFALFGATALGRMLWLEYREVFGWRRAEEGGERAYARVLSAPSLRVGLRNLFYVLYIWNNTFLLLGALLRACFPKAEIDPLVAGFVAVAVLNNMPWIAITFSGFRLAWRADRER